MSDRVRTEEPPAYGGRAVLTMHEERGGFGTPDIWARLAAPIPPEKIAWRQDGRPVTRDGKYFARFVCYIEAGTVRARLDGVVPGEWDFELEILPVAATGDGVDAEQGFSFRGALTVLGSKRTGVGSGKNYKEAATDTFKRAAVLFGIGHELYDYEQNWVEVDGDGKFAKPLVDPQVAYERKHGRPGAAGAPKVAQAEGEERRPPSSSSGAPSSGTSPKTTAARTTDEPACPKCGGRMWDNRDTKRNPKAPDYKCRDRSCDGVIWPPKGDKPGKEGAQRHAAARAADDREDFSEELALGTDDIPF